MWSAERPSNIAVIKYMGKKPEGKNNATNASLSWTLNHLKTKVVMEDNSKTSDIWLPIKTAFPFQMSEKGRKRYLAHLHFLKQEFKQEGHYTVSSGNNFPADCGIASSASSFAALTECATKVFSEKSQVEVSDLEKAKLSAKGSGSSCRSFLSGWVIWDGDKIKQVSSPWDKMHHMVVIAGANKKSVSSSDAHQRVLQSTLFEGRIERAEKRLEQSLDCFSREDWESFYNIVWQEFWDMHALFETSKPPFGYFLPETHTVLNAARQFWQENSDGPVVTMDAGANVHLLWREDQEVAALVFYKKVLENRLTCLSNIEGIGFAKV